MPERRHVGVAELGLGLAAELLLGRATVNRDRRDPHTLQLPRQVPVCHAGHSWGVDRLNALGSRLAQNGQLEDGEFDFNRPVGQGGSGRRTSDMPGGASVVGIASMTSYFGLSFTPGYGPAKAGLVQMMKTLAVSWGTDGIRANAVAAGLTRSNLTAFTFDHMQEMVDANIARQGIKRAGEPEDIAAAVLFLTSPAASWITGQTLPVDGGFTAGM